MRTASHHSLAGHQEMSLSRRAVAGFDVGYLPARLPKRARQGRRTLAPVQAGANPSILQNTVESVSSALEVFKSSGRYNLDSLPIPSGPLSDFASSAGQQLQTSTPHFGGRLAGQALESLRNAAAQVLPGLPPLPDLPNLPQLPSLPSFPFLPAAPTLPPVSLESFTQALTSLRDAATSTAAALSSPDNLSPQVVQERLQYLSNQLMEVGKVQQGLQGSVTSGLNPHFGSNGLGSALSSAGNWIAANGPQGLPTPEAAVADVSRSLAEASARLTAGLEGFSLPPGVDLGPLSTAGQQAADFVDNLLHPAQTAEAVAAAFAALQANGHAGHDFTTLVLAAAGVMVTIAVTVPDDDYAGPGPVRVDELSHSYDPKTVAEYFRRRPVKVVQRAGVLAAELAAFGSALLLDMWTGRLQVNEATRAVQLRLAIERLGPAYVKVAQALSTRVDLLTPQYFLQIQLLQDRVPPFPSTVAKEAMVQAFGRPVEQVFSLLSEQPIAAASLGQVYRATLLPPLGGGDVAVKVQRPGVLEAVALDLFLMRAMAVALQENAMTRTDWAAVIDEWAVRFFHEMDYVREARNSVIFKQQMAQLEGIMVADTIPGLCTVDVLTTQWVEGEKLSESNASDVRELCNTLLNAYLIQLLDTGFLHADPHPGNLIRTPDGKICILDFGLMTEVTPEQRIALVEYIAHLSTEDFYQVALDLQTLGFIPPGIGDPREIGLVEPLAAILSQIVGGGGAAKINIDRVIAELEVLSANYPFTIPPFFALILRAFSVIEGSALRVDPDYAIVRECFPYLSRRLLTDDSPRTKKLLKDVLYGGRKRLDVNRLLRLADGFGAFTTNGQIEGGVARSPPPATSPAYASSSIPASGSFGSSYGTGGSPFGSYGTTGTYGTSGSYGTSAATPSAAAAYMAAAPTSPPPLSSSVYPLTTGNGGSSIGGNTYPSAASATYSTASRGSAVSYPGQPSTSGTFSTPSRYSERRSSPVTGYPVQPSTSGTFSTPSRYSERSSSPVTGQSPYANSSPSATNTGSGMSDGFATGSRYSDRHEGLPVQQRQPARYVGTRQPPLLDPVLVEALQVVFSVRGSYVQELLVEELVAAVDALSREALSGVFRALLGSAPAMIAMSTLTALGPLRGVLVPGPTAVEVLSRLAPTVAVTEDDQEALEVVRGLLEFSQRIPPPPLSSETPARLAQVAGELQPLLPSLLPGLLFTGELFVRTLIKRVIIRFAESFTQSPNEYASTMAALSMMPQQPQPGSTSSPIIGPVSLLTPHSPSASAPWLPPSAVNGFSDRSSTGWVTSFSKSSDDTIGFLNSSSNFSSDRSSGDVMDGERMSSTSRSPDVEDRHVGSNIVAGQTQSVPTGKATLKDDELLPAIGMALMAPFLPRPRH